MTKGRDVVNWMKNNPGVTIPLLTFMLGCVLGGLVF